MRKSFMVPEPGTPHRLPGRIWELWWWSAPGGTGEGGARRCQVPTAAGLPQPCAPSPSPTDQSPAGHGASAQLLNKELGKSSFCVKTKWRFSAFGTTSGPKAGGW